MTQRQEPRTLDERIAAIEELLRRTTQTAVSGGGGVSDHASLSNVTANQHHAQSHTHPADGAVTLAHSATTGQTANDHHAQSHTQADHDAAEAADIAAVSTAAAAGTSTEIPNADHVHPHEPGHVAHDTIWDALGDLVVGTGFDTASRLPVGADDLVLTADAGEATGLKWAAASGGGGSVNATLVRKTADETVNNSDTLQNDDTLLFAVGASESWGFRIVVFHDSSTNTPNIKFALTIPAGATLAWGSTGGLDLNGNLRAPFVTTASGTAGAAFDTNATPMVTVLEGIVVNGATPGNVTLQWAQGTATSEDTRVLSGSYLVASNFASSGGTFAPVDADYLVGSANGTLTNEIVVGTTPGGELGGTWGSPTVDATHSGSAHHSLVTVGTGLDVTGQLVELDLSEVAAGGELAGFMDAPTVDATHSGSAHHAESHTSSVHDTAESGDLAAVAAAAASGSNPEVPFADHVHPHGSGYLADAHHTQAHTHPAEGAVVVTHASTTGQTANDHHTQAHDIDGADHNGFPGGTTTFLRADGTFATPAGGGGGDTLVAWLAV